MDRRWEETEVEEFISSTPYSHLVLVLAIPAMIVVPVKHSAFKQPSITPFPPLSSSGSASTFLACPTNPAHTLK